MRISKKDLMKRALLALLCFAVALGLSRPLKADGLIGVAFNSPNQFGPSPIISGPDPASTAANPLFGAANIWNNLNIPFGTLDANPAWNNLVDSTGAATGVDFSVAGNVAGLDMNFIPNLNPLRSEGMAWNNDGSGTIPNLSSSIDWSLTGLAPNATFDMCVYGMWANFNRSFNMTIQGSTQNVPTFDATSSTPTADCILFTNLKSDATGTISGVGTGIGAFSNTGEADWAGFQIVQAPVPEPSTLMLLGIGTLSFLGRFRKKPLS